MNMKRRESFEVTFQGKLEENFELITLKDWN
jgi:hypothetical protein